MSEPILTLHERVSGKPRLSYTIPEETAAGQSYPPFSNIDGFVDGAVVPFQEGWEICVIVAIRWFIYFTGRVTVEQLSFNRSNAYNT